MPEPTPTSTPVDCAVASQAADVKQVQLGLGYPTQKGPLAKVWCIRHVLISSFSGWGTTKLMVKDQIVYQTPCLPGACADASDDFLPPYQVDKGKTLRYLFTCFDDPSTTDIDECADATPDGATITIDYEAIVGP